MEIDPSTESAWVQLREKKKFSSRARRQIAAYCSSVEKKLKTAGVARPASEGRFDIQEVLILQQVMARSFASSLTILVACYALAMTVLFSISALGVKDDLSSSEVYQWLYGLFIATNTVVLMALLRKRMAKDRNIEATAIIMERRLAERTQQELKKYYSEQVRATISSGYEVIGSPAKNDCSLRSRFFRMFGK